MSASGQVLQSAPYDALAGTINPTTVLPRTTVIPRGARVLLFSNDGAAPACNYGAAVTMDGETYQPIESRTDSNLDFFGDRAIVCPGFVG